MVVEWRTITRWFETRRLRRRFRTTPVFALADLPEDTIGRVIAPARPLATVLQAPLTNRPCVYYAIEIHEFPGQPGETLATEHRSVPFVLDEAGHRAIVDPTSATVSLVFDHVSTSKAAFDATPVQRSLLEMHGLVHRDWFHTSYLEYREAVIEVGERIAVLGSGVREADPDAPPTDAYRTSGQTRLRLTSSPKHPLVISDDPRWMC